MKNREKIVLPDEKRKEMIKYIKDYFLTGREEEWGELASSQLLNFIIKELAPEFYNQGVYDAYKYINDKSEDLLSLLV
jgi:uncharacterized protein (DUF2164 family)